MAVDVAGVIQQGIDPGEFRAIGAKVTARLLIAVYDGLDPEWLVQITGMNIFNNAAILFVDLLTILSAVLKRPAQAIGVRWGILLPPSFRERLFIAVIAVNIRRYCTCLHRAECGHRRDRHTHK